MRASGLFAFLLTVPALSQQLPPTVGIQLSDSDQIDIRFPLTVSQCDPVPIYYNTTSPLSFVGIDTTILTDINIVRPRRLITISVPVGIGYLEWICNIPAGYSFIAEYSYRRLFTVQPGSSSSCLRDITATYDAASYLTSDFRTYTANPPQTIAFSIPDTEFASSSVPFPIGLFSTTTVNPDLAFALTVPTTLSPPTATSESSPSTPTSSRSSRSGKKKIIAVVCSAVVIAIIASAVTCACLCRRRERHPRPRPRSITPPAALEEAEEEEDMRNYDDHVRDAGGSISKSTWVSMNTTSDRWSVYGPLLQATEVELGERPRPVRSIQERGGVVHTSSG